MYWHAFATYCEKLEHTSSRLSLIDILSSLFREVDDPKEAQKITYLIQGRIAPFFIPLEMGMAERTMASAIAKASGISREDVLIEFDRLGDMGTAAQRLLTSAGDGDSPAIHEVFETFTQIAQTTGEGTIEKKITLMAALLRRMDPLSARFCVRIPLGNLRLGIGDPTVLDGIATARLGDKKQRVYLEGAYNRTSDLGLIARTLWEIENPINAVDAVEALQVRVGNPVRAMLCERLPDPKTTIEKMGEVIVQKKFDGFRVQLHKSGDDIRMYSRNLEDMTHMFPELIDAARIQIQAKDAILDCEALAYQPESEEFLPFQETTKRRRKHGIDDAAKLLPLRAFAFDILYKDGASVMDAPLTERLEILRKTLKEGETILLAKSEIVADATTLSRILEESIEAGLEGVVIKKPSSQYVAGGRNMNWVKLKRNQSGSLNDTVDCVVLGYIHGRGKRTAFGAGALLVGVYDPTTDQFVTVTKIGTGLTDEEWTSIRERSKGLETDLRPPRVESAIIPSVWLKPQLVIEVLADEITKSPLHTAGYALRFPRLVSFRDADKRPEDATTVSELINLYTAQEKK
jgi:DNA ligase-1